MLTTLLNRHHRCQTCTAGISGFCIDVVRLMRSELTGREYDMRVACSQVADCPRGKDETK